MDSNLISTVKLKRQRNLQDDQIRDLQSFGSDYHPCSQSRKISIGVVADASVKLRPQAGKEGGSVLPNRENVMSSIEVKNKESVATASLERKQAEVSKQKTDPSISSSSAHQETTNTKIVQLHANGTSILQSAIGMQKNSNVETQIPTTETVQFYANRTSILQSGDGLQRKFDNVAYGRIREKDTKRVEEFAFATEQEFHVLEKGSGEVKTANRSFENDVLKMKLWEILETAPTPKKQHSDSQISEVCAKNLEPARHLDKKGSKDFVPRQNSDTIEPDSESPDQALRRPVTRSLTRKKAPTKTQPKLWCKINKNENLPSSSSHRRKYQGKNIFSFDETEGWSASLHAIVNGGSSLLKRKKIERKSSRIEPRRIFFPENVNSENIQQATDRSKTPPAERTATHSNRTESSHGYLPRKSREYLLSKTGTVEDSHCSPVKKRRGQQEHLDSPPLTKNAGSREGFAGPSLEKNAEPQDNFCSPTFGTKAPIKDNSPSSPSPKSRPMEQDVHGPAPPERLFAVKGFCSLRTSHSHTSKAGSFGSDAQTESSNDTRELKESPIRASSPVMKEKDAETRLTQSSSEDTRELKESPIRASSPVVEEKGAEIRLAQSSSEEQDAESSEEDFLINKGCRATETWFAGTGSPDKTPAFILRPSKRLRNQEGININELNPTSPSLKGNEKGNGLLEPSKLNQEDELARAVSLFAFALEKFKTKMQSQTIKKSSEILASVADGIQLQLQNVESKIQTDVRKFTSLSKSKRKHLETRFQEQQERLKLIYDKFKEDVDHHFQDCKVTLEELDTFQIELKGNAERQKVSHRKLLLQVEEAIETQLGNAERRITAVHKVAREKMLQLKYVLTECLKEGLFH